MRNVFFDGRGNFVQLGGMEDADLPHLVIGACMKVHQALGPGLSPQAYRECLAMELRDLEMDVERDRALTFDYRGRTMEAGVRLDFIVNDRLLLQTASQPQTTDLDKERFESFLRLSGLKMGVWVNFDVTTLRKGIHRVTLKRKAAGET